LLVLSSQQSDSFRFLLSIFFLLLPLLAQLHLIDFISERWMQINWRAVIDAQSFPLAIREHQIDVGPRDDVEYGERGLIGGSCGFAAASGEFVQWRALRSSP
ncbi:hypothetical protein PENTCL1PPCAC_19779, partial [Pristionchus entomophagus]